MTCPLLKQNQALWKLWLKDTLGNKRKKRNVSFWQFSHKFLQSWVLQWNTCVPINIERLNLAIVHSHQSAPLANSPSYFGVNLTFVSPDTWGRPAPASYLICSCCLLHLPKGPFSPGCTFWSPNDKSPFILPSWRRPASNLILAVCHSADKRELNLSWASIYN